MRYEKNKNLEKVCIILGKTKEVIIHENTFKGKNKPYFQSNQKVNVLNCISLYLSIFLSLSHLV